MKQQIQIVALVMAAMFTSSAFSEGKPVTRIDFNKMIDENNATKKELHMDVTASEHAAKPVKKDDKGKVIDFIDVEIGVGQSPSVVDRRFDSIGEAKIVELN